MSEQTVSEKCKRCVNGKIRKGATCSVCKGTGVYTRPTKPSDEK